MYLEIENLCKSFGDREVLRNISFGLEKGESLAIIGGSGSGKSVLIKNIIGFIVPDSGRIMFEGNDISRIPLDEKNSFLNKIGVLFQASALFDSLTVWENITFALRQRKKITINEAKEVAANKLSLVGMSADSMHLYPSSLSGGMQKRVGLARAISCDPEILFFDEPTTGLDPVMSRTISDLIAEVLDYTKATGFIITHDMNCVRIASNKLTMIRNSELVWFGQTNDMTTDSNEYVKEFINLQCYLVDKSFQK